MNEQCPRCGSYKTQKLGKLATFFALLGTGSCLIWVGILFPPLWILSVLLILGSPLGFLVPNMTTCKDCKCKWKSGEAEKYKEAMVDIKEITIEETTGTNVIDDYVKPEPVKKNLEEGLIKRIKFPTVGLNYEDRRKVLTDIIKQHKDADLFMFESYEGLTNKEIKEDYFTERIYEITDGLSECVLEKEDENEYDPNALKVLVKDKNNNFHHIGYVPKENCEEIRELMDKYRILIGTTITGGKYKEVDYDDMGEERIRTRSTKYGLNVHVSFWED